MYMCQVGISRLSRNVWVENIGMASLYKHMERAVTLILRWIKIPQSQV